MELLRVSRRQPQSIKLPEWAGASEPKACVTGLNSHSFRTHKALLPHQGTGQQEALWKLQCAHRCPPGESQHVDTCPRCHQQRVSGSQGNSTCQPGRSPPPYSEKWEGFAVFAERLRGGTRAWDPLSAARDRADLCWWEGRTAPNYTDSDILNCKALQWLF